MIPFVTDPPRSVCILRLSAIGDTCHVVPIVRTLQHAWPATQLTWIIGKSEARLMSLIEGVEFITVDKRAGLIIALGGNVKMLDALPPHSRAGDNDNAFCGGFRLWQSPQPHAGARPKPRS